MLVVWGGAGQLALRPCGFSLRHQSLFFPYGVVASFAEPQGHSCDEHACEQKKHPCSSFLRTSRVVLPVFLLSQLLRRLRRLAMKWTTAKPPATGISRGASRPPIASEPTTSVGPGILLVTSFIYDSP